VDVATYLERLHPVAMRLGLERMGRAMEALGHPERRLPALHVAGTNGKGSTCAMVAAALQAAGHRVGLYTSPHLVTFHERIQVDGEPISDAQLEAHLGEVRAVCPWHERGQDPLSYFEMATAVAFLHFARSEVTAAVVEVGLGGRLDATNVLAPRACAIARIGLDHQEILGGTLQAIAREKAGILKPGIPAVTGAQPPAALEVLRDQAARMGSPLTVVPSYSGPIGLRGDHQRENASLAAGALALLEEGGLTVSPEALRKGISGARWPGRLEEVAGVLLDGAHNPDGAQALARALPNLYPARPVELIFGVLADKDHRAMLRALAPLAREIHLVTPRSPRARSAASCLDVARESGLPAHTHTSCAEAIACARAGACGRGLVAVAGSLYLVGEARALLARA
jgi:dihydrofolate synthase/folylpolyglutamate synthase